MLDETLTRIETTVETANTLPEGQKAELLRLLTILKDEITTLEHTHAEQAESVVGFVERSSKEATRTSKNPRLISLAAQGLAVSVDELELSHPQLVHVVNALSTLLSNIGI
jgi:hypothetical protein